MAPILKPPQHEFIRYMMQNNSLAMPQTAPLYRYLDSYSIPLLSSSILSRLREGSRLTLSQLVFRMNRLNPRGSVVLLLHRDEAWDTTCVLNVFNHFSDIQLYKNPSIHAIKSSFSLVAKHVNLEYPFARTSISY